MHQAKLLSLIDRIENELDYIKQSWNTKDSALKCVNQDSLNIPWIGLCTISDNNKSVQQLRASFGNVGLCLNALQSSFINNSIDVHNACTINTEQHDHNNDINTNRTSPLELTVEYYYGKANEIEVDKIDESATNTERQREIDISGLQISNAKEEVTQNCSTFEMIGNDDKCVREDEHVTNNNSNGALCFKEKEDSQSTDHEDNNITDSQVLPAEETNVNKCVVCSCHSSIHELGDEEITPKVSTTRCHVLLPSSPIPSLPQPREESFIVDEQHSKIVECLFENSNESKKCKNKIHPSDEKSITLNGKREAVVDGTGKVERHFSKSNSNTNRTNATSASTQLAKENMLFLWTSLNDDNTSDEITVKLHGDTELECNESKNVIIEECIATNVQNVSNILTRHNDNDKKELSENNNFHDNWFEYRPIELQSMNALHELTTKQTQANAAKLTIASMLETSSPSPEESEADTIVLFNEETQMEKNCHVQIEDNQPNLFVNVENLNDNVVNSINNINLHEKKQENVMIKNNESNKNNNNIDNNNFEATKSNNFFVNDKNEKILMESRKKEGSIPNTITNNRQKAFSEPQTKSEQMVMKETVATCELRSSSWPLCTDQMSEILPKLNEYQTVASLEQSQQDSLNMTEHNLELCGAEQEYEKQTLQRLSHLSSYYSDITSNNSEQQTNIKNNNKWWNCVTSSENTNISNNKKTLKYLINNDELNQFMNCLNCLLAANCTLNKVKEIALHYTLPGVYERQTNSDGNMNTTEEWKVLELIPNGANYEVSESNLEHYIHLVNEKVIAVMHAIQSEEMLS